MFMIHLSLSIVRYAFAWANWTGEQFQRMTYDLLHGLKAEVSNTTTYNKATNDLYESNRILHKELTKAMEKLTDVEVIVQNSKSGA
jgi:hypothetical protein